MKKSLIALAVLSACAGTAYADDSSLTMYGIVDVGILTVNHSANFNNAGFVTGVPIFGTGSNLGAVNRATGLMSGGQSFDRLGIRGTEDLGNGMKAFFTLENGFNINNGTISTSALNNTVRTGVSGAADTALNNQLFGRAAFAGVSGAWGALSGGRVTTVQIDMIGRYDPVNAGEFSPISFSGQYGGGGTTDNSRVDNAIKYVGKWDAFNLSAVHKFGGIAGSNGAQNLNQVNIGWEQGQFGIQASYEMANDTTKLDNNGTAGAPYAGGAVGVTWVNTRSWMLAAKWDATTALSFKAIYERMTIMNPSNPAVDATITTIYNFPVHLTSTAPFNGTPNQILNVYVIGANYDFTPAMKGSLGYYHVTQNDFTGGVTTAGASGKLAGNDNYLSGMLEYKLSKRTNLYGAFMYDKKSGGFANGVNGTTIGASTGVTSYTGIGAGVRHIF